MDGNEVLALERTALEVRKDVVRMTGLSRAPSLGPSLSVVDIMTVLYFHTLSIRTEDPKWPERDRFVLSKSNACPALYAILARRGFFDREELWSFRRLGAMLQGTLDPKRTPGIDAPGGGPGTGLGIANGIALACRMETVPSRVFCLLGDGELNEGSIWESVLAASLFRLKNLTAIVEVNGAGTGAPQGAEDYKEMAGARFEAFGWRVLRTDGHCVRSLAEAFLEIAGVGEGPSVLLANTQWGKGVASAEKGRGRSMVPPSRERVENALLELEKAGKSLEEGSPDDR
ncbi:MAG: transketolase [Synergistales bacterium]